MKKIFFLIFTAGISFIINDLNAQVITGSALYGPLGGIRILNGQGETAANPAIGFSAKPGAYPADLNDGGGGNGIFRPEANVMAFSTLSKERMRISPGGNLGIGLTYPTATLDVNGNQGSTSTSANFRVTYNQPGNISLVGTEFSALRNLQTTHQGTVNSWAAMYAKAGSAEYAGVFDGKTIFNGKVRIGNVPITNTSGTLNNYNLFVEKGILTEKLKVALKTSANWADYVFSKDYKLKPLQEVEKFILINNHLPNMPSAEALVADGGVEVGEMLAKQMEKIEELTLYIIQQNKDMKQMQNRISQLEKK